VSQFTTLPMKTLLSLGLALFALTSAHAQIFRSGALHVANRGHVQAGDRSSHGGWHRGYVYRNTGGHWHSHGHSHHSYWPRVVSYPYGYYRGYDYGYVPAYSYYSGYGYGYPYYGSYGYYGSGSAAANGVVIGALAGGIIGHNSGDFRHNGWRGAAWGAGLGWLLGSVVDANRRAVVYESTPTVVQPAQATYVPPAQPAQAQPQQVTIINNYYGGSAMSGVNGLFGR
jgi:hypothetical protein